MIRTSWMTTGKVSLKSNNQRKSTVRANHPRILSRGNTSEASHVGPWWNRIYGTLITDQDNPVHSSLHCQCRNEIWMNLNVEMNIRNSGKFIKRDSFACQDFGFPFTWASTTISFPTFCQSPDRFRYQLFHVLRIFEIGWSCWNLKSILSPWMLASIIKFTFALERKIHNAKYQACFKIFIGVFFLLKTKNERRVDLLTPEFQSNCVAITNPFVDFFSIADSKWRH